MRLAFIALLLTPAIVSAHGMLVIPTVHPKGVSIEVKYDDDTAAVGATVRVVNAAGEELSRGVTDGMGVVELPRPAELAGCVAKAEDGMGHAASARLPIPPDEQATITAENKPNRLLSTVGGLAIIAVTAWLLRRLWPKPEQIPPPA